MAKDACYHKVKARYKVFPSAYASGALSKCRKVGAANWGNKSRAAVASDTEAWQRVALILGWSSWELGMKKEEDEKLTTKGIKQSKLNKKIKKKKL